MAGKAKGNRRYQIQTYLPHVKKWNRLQRFWLFDANGDDLPYYRELLTDRNTDSEHLLEYESKALAKYWVRKLRKSAFLKKVNGTGFVKGKFRLVEINSIVTEEVIRA